MDIETAQQITQIVYHTDWKVLLASLAVCIAAGGLIYNFLRNFKADINLRFEQMDQKFDKKFEKHERRLEQMDQRLFLLCMGKTLPEILKSEREESK